MTDAEEQSANLIVGRITVELDQARCEIDRLRVALKPLALVAQALDEDSGPYIRSRADTFVIWYANYPNPNNLTLGHARAARKALEG